MGMRARASNDGDSRGAGRHRHARSSARRRTVPLVAIASAAVFFSVSGTAGTYALLTARASTSTTSTVITSGTADLSLSTLPLTTTALYPGLTLYGAVTATNTGDVPLVLGVSGLTAPGGSAANALSQALIVGVGAPGTGAACTSGAVTPTWTGSFASATAAPIGVTVPVGAAQVLCVSVSLPLTAPTASQGQSAANFALRISGTQG